MSVFIEITANSLTSVCYSLMKIIPNWHNTIENSSSYTLSDKHKWGRDGKASSRIVRFGGCALFDFTATDSVTHSIFSDMLAHRWVRLSFLSVYCEVFSFLIIDNNSGTQQRHFATPVIHHRMVKTGLVPTLTLFHSEVSSGLFTIIYSLNNCQIQV